MTSQSQVTGTNGESWKPIPDFEGYDVSDQGRVRSYHRHIGLGEWTIAVTPQRILKPSNARYRAVNLMRDGKRCHLRTSKLVMLAFVGPRPEGLEVCHRNNDAHDDRLENLRYDTPEGNNLDRLGVDESVVVEVCERYAAGLSARQVSEESGISKDTVARWARGESFTTIERPVTRKGRGKHPRKLSSGQVREVVGRYGAGGVFQRELAEEFGVSVSFISRLVNGERRAECLNPA